MNNQNDSNPWLDKFRRSQPLLLGIDQGTHAVRYVLFDSSKGEIRDWGTYEFKGSDQNKRQISQFFKDLSKKFPTQQLGGIGVNIQGNSVMAGRFHLTQTERASEAELIRMALRNILSFPVEDAVYHCQEYKPAKTQEESEEGVKRYFNYVAVEKNVLTSMLEPVTENFPVSLAVTVQGYALESLFGSGRLNHPGKTIALLNIGRGITAILIYGDGKLIFQREIPLAGQDITRSILILYRDEASPEKMLELKQAEQLKKEIVIPLGKDGAGQEDAAAGGGSGESKNQKLFQAIKGVLSAWIQDVRLTFHYFYENYEAETIDKIYIFGGSAKLDNFIPYLKEQLGMDAELLKLPAESSIRIAKGKDENSFRENFHEYAGALSFCLKKEPAANLSHQKTLVVRYDEWLNPVFRVAYIFAAAVLVTWFFFLNIQYKSLIDVQTGLQAHGQFLKKMETPYVEMLKWQNFINKADAAAWPSSEILKAISQRTSSQILLSDISIERDGQRVTLEGTVFGDPKDRAVIIADFIRTLKETLMFKQIELPRLDPASEGEERGMFKITAQLTRMS